ncbi:hypothetical protein SAMN05216582_12522 [Selenomonas ruminantium]|uniref:Uncharacterized protein n=1 Tax=Selenomonas ruminantium TaxID=971 RepID=A0A1M6WI15_SELRU|nr:hypothetical protein SAMN05216582_12522 [Selenomonas ruminantium]
MSVIMLCLLMALLFMGRGLCNFGWQEGENLRQYREEMRLRLAAESAVETVWGDITDYESRFDSLSDGQKIDLSEQVAVRDADIETRVYALRKVKKVYLIACAFQRGTEENDILESHRFAKGVIEKVNDKEHYKWLGWTD